MYKIPALRFTYNAGLVEEVWAVFDDGKEYQIKDQGFVSYLNMLACTLPRENSTTVQEHPVDTSTTVTETTPVPTAEHRSESENVNHPQHYNSHPSGIECIEIARHHDFDIGNALKYIWRHGLKVKTGETENSQAVEDLEKAIWYLEDEISTIQKSSRRG